MKIKRWPCEFKYSAGDNIYYHHRSRDTYPGIVLQVKNQIVKISYNGLCGDIVTWVKQQSLSRQK